jgi:hypothetical protein
VLEEYANEEHQNENGALDRIQSSIFFILSLTNGELHKAVLSMLMHPDALTIRDTDLANYSDVLALVPSELALNKLPHFLKDHSRYLPTAITITSKQAQWYVNRLQRALDKNPDLISLAFEFDTLIATSDVAELMIKEDDELIIGGSETEHSDHIVRRPSLRILSASAAAKELS